MRLVSVIRDLPIEPPPPEALEISGVTHDSRCVEPGDLFVALVGQRYDGRVFVPQAIERGAVAVLASGPPPPGFEKPWLTAAAPRQLLGPLAARVYGHPDLELRLVGVTGTNGKSTVTQLLAAIFEAAGTPTGVLGTLGYRFGGQRIAADHTTPEATVFFRTLRRMRDAGMAAVVAEVSSHALAMGRVDAASFDLALFTNLTRDHFDFHPGFEEYFAAKRSLFDQLKPAGRAVVNVDDPYGRRLAEELPAALTFGSAGKVRPLEVTLDARGIRGRLATPRGELDFQTALLGRLNLENVSAAVAAAEALELPHEAVSAALAAQRPLPGRLEPVEAGQPFPVLIDYAHTDAALEAALRSLKELTGGGRVLLVFGCGGDRDPGKRALMGRVAGELADFAIVTSDNPRREDPLAIIAAVEEGLRQSGSGRYRILPDRREAIRRAIAQAGPGWAVLIAGKGHEEVQIVGDRELPFSDRDEARRALEERFGPGTPG